MVDQVLSLSKYGVSAAIIALGISVREELLDDLSIIILFSLSTYEYVSHYKCAPFLRCSE